MEWDKGYSASYYMAVVDPVTWLDVGRIEITGGSISREYSGLRQSADVDCINYPRGVEQWVRIYLDAKQSGSSAHEPLFTGLATSPDRNIKGTWDENSIACYSVLKPADDVLLERGWYAPVDVSVLEIVEQLLKPVPAPLNPIDSSFLVNAPTLTEAIVAEDGETHLTMIEKLLVSVDWDLRIAGDGSLSLIPNTYVPVITFDPLEFDVIETEISITEDWYGCPNVFMAVSGDTTAVAKDESDDSILSIQNRGREVWMYDSSCDLSDAETIGEYAQRRLSEEQRYVTNISYDRRYVPGVLPGDYITLHYPAQGLDGDYIIKSQSIELSHGAKTSEDVIGG